MPNAELTDKRFTHDLITLPNGESKTALQVLCANLPLKPVTTAPAGTPADIAAGNTLIDTKNCAGACHALEKLQCSNKVQSNLGNINLQMQNLTLTTDQVRQVNAYLNSFDHCNTTEEPQPLQPNPTEPPKVKPRSVSQPNPVNFTSTLKAQHSQKCLDIEGVSTTKGANALQFQCNGDDNQAFTFTPVAGKERTYTITAKHSGLCLDVEGNSTKKGANVLQRECHGDDNQQFRLDVVNSKTFTVHPVHSNLCLDVFGESTNNRANVIQWTCNGDQNQQWKIDNFTN